MAMGMAQTFLHSPLFLLHYLQFHQYNRLQYHITMSYPQLILLPFRAHSACDYLWLFKLSKTSKSILNVKCLFGYNKFWTNNIRDDINFKFNTNEIFNELNKWFHNNLLILKNDKSILRFIIPVVFLFMRVGRSVKTQLSN